MLCGKPGSGKAQPNSTKIPTPQGTKTIGELQVDDIVFDRLGRPTKVLAIYPQGIKDNYKITLSDGRVAYCNEEHLWSYYTTRGNLRTISLKDMMSNGITNAQGKSRYYIPLNEPIQYPKKELDVDPYVIGAFLGDGCCLENSLTLSSEDEELVSEIASLIGATEYHRQSDRNYSWSFYQSPKTYHKGIKARLLTRDIFSSYKSELCCGTQEKRIPQVYKEGSIEQRYALVQGLLDTDGSIDNANKGRVTFTNTNLLLIKDLQEVLWSLGIVANISTDMRSSKYTHGACYTLCISCKKEDKAKLFRLSRKRKIAEEYAKIASIYKHDRIAITNIEKMEKPEEMTCILVDNEEHLYITEDYIVTHNTYLAFGYLFS